MTTIISLHTICHHSNLLHYYWLRYLHSTFCPCDLLSYKFVLLNLQTSPVLPSLCPQSTTCGFSASVSLTSPSLTLQIQSLCTLKLDILKVSGKGLRLGGSGLKRRVKPQLSFLQKNAHYTSSLSKHLYPHHGMEEPGGLQSMGSWRVGHDWAT